LTPGTPSPRPRLCTHAVPRFATIEADQEQINLTRFELSLPEETPVFLEGQEQFNQRFRTFYSRRIEDITAGGKLLGKTGSLDDGLSFGAVRPGAAAGGRTILSPNAAGYIRPIHVAIMGANRRLDARTKAASALMRTSSSHARSE